MVIPFAKYRGRNRAVTVQVLDTKFFSRPSGLAVALAGAVPVVAQAVTVARPSARLPGAGEPGGRPGHCHGLGNHGHGAGKRHGQV